jgi:oligopeptide/dipeptide ABC transporter ATP-binding protein
MLSLQVPKQEPLLEIRNLSVRFKVAETIPGIRAGRWLEALHGIDLTIKRGESLGLVGESGSGKSTLARCIARLEEPSAGTILMDGQAMPSRPSREQRRKVQLVFQDPYSSLNPRMKVGRMLAELLRVHGVVPSNRIARRCVELLEQVGLGSDALGKYPREFSGGQRQRVAIARALAVTPELLIADEPVSALDVSVQATILNLLAVLRRELGLTMLFIAHDLAVVRHVCDHVAVLYLGRIVELGRTEDVFHDPRHPYTLALIASIPKIEADGVTGKPALVGEPPSPLNVPHGCRFHPRCPIAEPVCSNEEPPLFDIADHDGHHAACFFAQNVRR